VIHERAAEVTRTLSVRDDACRCEMMELLHLLDGKIVYVCASGWGVYWHTNGSCLGQNPYPVPLVGL
jgi:hypothetical protein